jgi:hypothetical protein
MKKKLKKKNNFSYGYPFLPFPVLIAKWNEILGWDLKVEAVVKPWEDNPPFVMGIVSDYN